MLKSFPNKLLWAFAFIVISLAYIFGLFVDLTGDSGLYAAISRQMVETGDWFNLKINGTPYDQKPHLLFWLAGIGIKLLGNNNFAFKLFPFIYSLFGIYFTFRLGKDLISFETGKLAALIYGTSQILLLYSFDIHTDTILQTGVMLAIWQLLVYLKNYKTVNFIIGFVGIGLAMLSKGPIGAILPFFTVIIYLLVRKEFRQLIHFKWIIGIIITLLVISPTLIHLYSSFGLQGLKFYFITNNLGRITGEYAGSSNNLFYYLETLLWAFLPWTVFVLAALFYEIKSWIKGKSTNILSISILSSVLILMLILSIAKGKAPNYFLIAVPPISIVTARYLSEFCTLLKKNQNALLKSQGIFLLLYGVFNMTVLFAFSENRIWVAILLAALILLLGSLSFKIHKNRLKRFLFISMVLIGILSLFLNSKLIPLLFEFQGARQALEIYETKREDDGVLLNLHLEEYELFFYAKEPVIQFSSWEEFYKRFDKNGTWVYTNQEGYKGILNLKHNLDTVYTIKQRGMNEITFSFLWPETRNESLSNNYLIKVR